MVCANFTPSNSGPDLLGVADNVERALGAIRAHTVASGDTPAVVQSLVEGVAMIEGELQRTFSKHGIEKIAALHAPFDPNLHQAISQVEDPEAESGSVHQELQTGYTLHGRLLRATLVNVVP